MGSLSSLILVYVGIQRLLAYSISDLIITLNIRNIGLFRRFYKIIVRFFFFFHVKMQTKDQTVLWLQFVKETQN